MPGSAEKQSVILPDISKVTNLHFEWHFEFLLYHHTRHDCRKDIVFNHDNSLRTKNEFLLIFNHLQQKDLSFPRIFLLNFPEDVTFSIVCNILIIIVLQNDCRFLVLIGLTRWSKTATIIGKKCKLLNYNILHHFSV